MAPSQRKEVRKTVRAAQIRVSQFFGGLDGHPKIFACSTEGGRNAPDLSALTWVKDIWLLNYGTARHAVGKWYERGGLHGLLRLASELKGGKKFEAMFNASHSGTQP